MTVEYTTNFSLVAVRNESPSAGDWAATYWNWKVADALLYNAAVAHKHDNEPALANPAGYLTLSTSDTGGTLPAGTTYYFVATFLDAMGRETGKSAQSVITTASPISAPGKPTYTQATDLVATADALTGAVYGYKLSYVKGGGETTCGEAEYIVVPTDQTYAVTIHFDSLDDVGNGADKIFIYRKINNGGWNKLIEITSSSRDYYTDNNTAVPTCDIGPKTANTTNSFNTITIDWSTITNYTDADYIRLYVSTTTDGAATPTARWVSTNMLVIASIPLILATIPTQHTWTGTTLLTGNPPAVSQSLPSPSKIDLETEAQGNLPWANLPSDFVWLQPVANYASLGTGSEDGEVRLTLDTMTLYGWDADTGSWSPISGGGITRVVIPSAEADQPMENYLPTTALQDGDVCFISTNIEQNVDYAYRTGLYQYHANWATPTWVRLNTIPMVPAEIVDLWNDQFTSDTDAGILSIEETAWGTHNLVVAGSNWPGKIPLQWEEHMLYTGLIHDGYYQHRVFLYKDFSYDENAWYYDSCYEWLYSGQLGFTTADGALVTWDSDAEEWAKIPACYFRGAGGTLPAYQDENDIYILDDKIKKSTLQATRNILLSEEQAGIFKAQTVAETIDGWDIVNGASISKSTYGAAIGFTIQVTPKFFGDAAGSGIETTPDYYVPVSAGVDYVFSFYHIAGGGNYQWKVWLKWYDSGKSLLSSNSDTFNISTLISRKEITATAPVSAAYCGVYIHRDDTLTSGVYLSQLQFEEGTSASTWVSPVLDWETIGFSKYRGTFLNTSALPATAEDNDIAYVLQDDSATPCERWYIYDGGWEAAGVRATGQHIAAISTDMSTDAEENELKGKINEIIARLQDAGVIV